jgi:glycine cleavage system transcriptional repressor
MPEDLVAVTAIGNDRPGIVAGVTRVLYELGCNLEDVSSTILRGHFSMMLTVRAPEGVDASALEDRLGEVARELELVITARPVQEAALEVAPPTHVVSVYGADQPGIVYKVAAALAERGVNITALSSRVLGAEESPVYALLLEVAAGSEDVTKDLGAVVDELGVDVTVHPFEPDVF